LIGWSVIWLIVELVNCLIVWKFEVGSWEVRGLGFWLRVFVDLVVESFGWRFWVRLLVGLVVKRFEWRFRVGWLIV